LNARDAAHFFLRNVQTRRASRDARAARTARFDRVIRMILDAHTARDRSSDARSIDAPRTRSMARSSIAVPVLARLESEREHRTFAGVRGNIAFIGA
jgi:hypothetical protein